MHRKSIGSDGAVRLQAIHLFAGLSTGQRQMLARLVEEIVADPGEELMHEGDFGYEMVFVEEGSAEVRQGGVTINTVGAGEAVGEIAVLTAGGTRTATVVVTETLRGMVLTSHFMHHVKRQMPDMAAEIDRAAQEHLRSDRLRQAGRPPA
jgi:CRP-like cAMP-binding protein